MPFCVPAKVFVRLALAHCLALVLYDSALAQDFRLLFDGTSLKGWHVSAASDHSRTSAHRSGGRWTVEAGAIIGTQDQPGNGGLLLSDDEFGDVEIELEARNDFGIDSGIFLRSTEAGAAYQCMVDYYPGGTIGGVYCEGLTGDLHVRNFSFLDRPELIELVDGPFPLPVAPGQWPSLWRVGQWNRILVRIEGNPPRIRSAINGITVMDFTDKELRLGASGRIGLQLHGGEQFWGLAVRYRDLRIRRLD
ncbi:MAG: DUF1080 domain-containing protein [Proteobacteria bacterium]|nr:DUF1080 domain-containing protein [Pseudomonadota bacterium]